MNIKTGDMVKILSGKDRGTKAKVVRILPRDFLILVDGVNLKKKHRKSRRQDRKGEIVLVPAPLSLSSVQVICPSCGKPTRVGHAIDGSGAKMRVCKKCGKPF